MVFGLLILKEAKGGTMLGSRADELFHLVALCITGSILAHSSTDVVVARWLGRNRVEDDSYETGQDQAEADSRDLDKAGH